MHLIKLLLIVAVIGAIMKFIFEYITKKRQYELKIKNLENEVLSLKESMGEFHKLSSDFIESYKIKVSDYLKAQENLEQAYTKVYDIAENLIKANDNIYEKINIIATLVDDSSLSQIQKDEYIQKYLNLIDEDIKFNNQYKEILLSLSDKGQDHEKSR